MNQPLRVVMDTSVLVCAFRSRQGASFAFLQQVRQRRIQLTASNALMLEYEAVLLRPEHRQRAGLTMQEAANALDELTTYLDPSLAYFSYRPQLSDPNDELVLHAAINGFAAAIITHNVSDFLPAALTFQVQVLQPSTMLRKGRTS